jgi:hypothetical protein
MRRTVALGAALFSLLWAGGRVRADQGGIPFWFSGQYASFAAVPQDPGVYLPVTLYYFQGSADISRTLQRGVNLTAGLDSKAPLAFISPMFVPDLKVLGARLGLSLSWGGGYNWSSAELTGPLGTDPGTSDSVWGITDLFPLVNLAWGGALNNAMIYGTGDIPVGTYQSNRLSNIGLGHGAADFGGGYTFLSKKIGTEASAVVGFTFNVMNPTTNYKNGVDFHLDWAVSQFLSKSFHLGIVGYVYDQISGDSGSGDKVGSFESKAVALGGEAGYFFRVAGQQWYANVRGYTDLWTQNRLPGFALFGVLNIPVLKL